METLTSGMLKTGSQVLEKLTIRGSVKNIGSRAFDSNGGYTTSPQNESQYNGYAFEGNAELEIEEGVKTIGPYAFRNCRIFSEISFPASLTSVGEDAFGNCGGMTDLLFRGTNMSFADSALSGCGNLTIYMADENAALAQYCALRNIPYDKTTSFSHLLTLVINRENADDAETLTLDWLDELNLPAPVWEGHDFGGWYRDAAYTSQWTDTKMPAHDLTLYAGWDVELRSLTLVPNYGDEETSRLSVRAGSELALPAPVWEGRVFSGWYHDAELTERWRKPYMPGEDLTLYAGWDIDVYTLTLELCGGSAEKTEYLVHTGDSIRVNAPTRAGYFFLGWSLDGNSLGYGGTMPSADTTLYALWQAESANGRFRNDGDHMTLIGYDRLEEESAAFYLPETVDGLPMTAIAAGAFANSGVKSLYIPASVTEIEPGAFSQCSSLLQFHVSENNSVYSSKNGSIYSKDGMAILFFPPAGQYSVYLSKEVRIIGERAFDGTLLKSIALPDSVTEIGDRAFRNTAITKIVLPESVQSIGERAFTGCRELALVEAMGSPETVDSSAFNGCSGFLLAYGPDEDCVFRRVMRNNGYLYNAYTLTMVQPTKTTTAFLQSGAELMLPEKPATSENTQFTGWYLVRAFTAVLTENTMPAYELTIYAGTVQLFDYETLTSEAIGERSLSLTVYHALFDPLASFSLDEPSVISGTVGESVQLNPRLVPASIIQYGGSLHILQ